MTTIAMLQQAGTKRSSRAVGFFFTLALLCAGGCGGTQPRYHYCNPWKGGVARGMPLPGPSSTLPVTPRLHPE